MAASFILLIVLLCLALFWPRFGLVNRWRQMRELSARVLREDALKHIHKAKVNGRRPTLQSVAGSLHIHSDRAADLLAHMEKRGLLTFASGQPQMDSSRGLPSLGARLRADVLCDAGLAAFGRAAMFGLSYDSRQSERSAKVFRQQPHARLRPRWDARHAAPSGQCGHGLQRRRKQLGNGSKSRSHASEWFEDRLAFLHDNQPEWEATPEKAGVFYVPVDVRDERTVKLFELVRYTRQRVNLLIVAAHWGANWGYSPPPAHIEFSHALVTAGADVVFGHSAHVVRGIEIHQGRPIIYSAGNFIDDYAVDVDQRNDHSFIFVLEMDGQTPHNLRMYPTVIRDCQARLAKGPEAREIGETMVKLCCHFDTPASWKPAEQCLEIGINQKERSE